MARVTNDERLSEHSRRLKMLEDVFVPMAKAAMEILMGKPGEPGMGENMRMLSSKVDEVLEAQQEAKISRRHIDQDLAQLKIQAVQKQETKLLGMKIGADTRRSIIAGLFMIAGIVISKFI